MASGREGGPHHFKFKQPTDDKIFAEGNVGEMYRGFSKTIVGSGSYGIVAGIAVPLPGVGSHAAVVVLRR